MKTNLTEQESLSVITEMIDRARNNVQQGAGSSMIFWGLFIAFIAILNVVLIYVLPSPNQSFWVWTLCLPGFLVNNLIERKNDRTALVKTHIDKIIEVSWQSFALAVATFLVVIFATAYFLREPRVFCLINPIILLMTGVVLMITSSATRFKPFMWGAKAMYVGAILCVAVIVVTKQVVVVQFLFLAACMIFGFVIPGIKLNKLANHA